MMIRSKSRALLGAACLTGLLASGCSGFWGATDDTELPGERISVITLEGALTADRELAADPVTLPPPATNPDWPQPGGNPAHLMGHLTLGEDLSRAWQVNIGDGSDEGSFVMASPVIAGGQLFTLDSGGALRALEAGSGRELWSFDANFAEEDDAMFSSGITVGPNSLFLSSGAGELVAVSSDTGLEQWRVKSSGPIRSAPTYGDGRIFVTTLANQTQAFAAADGERLWNHAGIAEVSAILGGASPALMGDVVLAPYSSGELVALKAETGQVFWSESLGQVRTGAAVSKLADIQGAPVVDGAQVIAISHSGVTAALDGRSGTRIWDQRVGGVHMPWVAGDYIFIVSSAAEVICLNKKDGRVRWVVQLAQFEDEEDREGNVHYAGPVLAGDRLVVASSLGILHLISPYDGAQVARIDVGSAIFNAPIVANETLYVLTDNGTLHAYR